MRYVKGADKFYRHQSFWGIMLLGVLPFIEANTPLINAVVPEQYQKWGMLVIAIVVAWLRFVKQERLSDAVDKDAGNV